MSPETCRFLVFLAVFCAAEGADLAVVVTTPLGRVQGQARKTRAGTRYAAFEGIPYARPPVGPLRFRDPEPVEGWTGTWDASHATLCAQTAMLQLESIQGDEDCLHVNVYVPQHPHDNLDVIAHIHGGGFMYGSGHGYANPEYFIDSGRAVFATFNYRLGIFGFLSTEDDVVSGNMGLKDQVLALEWLQNNIASFGGNPKSVTLTGLSSGGSSVHLHYLSDMSKNLFHRGFSQSGVALNYFALQEGALAKAKMVAAALQCPTSTTEGLVKCLRERPFRSILSKMGLLRGYKFLPHSPFGPVLEKGPNPFMAKNPYYLLAKGRVHDLPWLTSTVSHEGLFPAAFVYKDLEEVNDNWEKIAPFLLDYNNTLATPLLESIAKQIKTHYVGSEEKITESNFLKKFVKIFTDRLLVDVDQAVRWQARANTKPVYYYQISFIGRHSTNETVAHGEDGQYYFHNMYGRQLSADELKVRDFLMEVLLVFARTGEVKVEGWTPVTAKKIFFLNVTSPVDGGNRLEGVGELAPKEFWTSLGFLENQNLVMIKDEL